MKKVWSPSLMEEYTAEDVVEYFKEVEELERRSFLIKSLSGFFEIYPPETFFKPEVLEAGIRLVKKNKLDELNKRLSNFENNVIPNLKTEISKLKLEL